MRKLLLAIAVMCMGLPAAAQTPQVVKNPYYMLDFSVSAAGFDIRVNDITILKDTVRGQMGSMIPINNAVFKSGPQKISVKLTPLDGEKTLDNNAEFNLSFVLMDTTNGFEKISEKPLPSFDKKRLTGGKKETAASLHREATINAEVPYSIDILDNAADLRTVSGIEEKLKAAYTGIWNTLHDKKWNELNKIMEEKEKFIAKTMYLSDEESGKRMKDLVDEFTSGGYVLTPLPAKTIVSFSADGKLAALKTENGDDIITASSKDGGKIELMFSFYRPKGENALKPF